MIMNFNGNATTPVTIGDPVVGLRPPYFLVQNNGLYITLEESQYVSFDPHHSWLFNGILIFKNR